MQFGVNPGLDILFVVWLIEDLVEILFGNLKLTLERFALSCVRDF